MAELKAKAISNPKPEDFYLKNGEKAYGYIYMTKNSRTKRSYIGIHPLYKGEAWTDYYGSGVYLKDEMYCLEPWLFTNTKQKNTRDYHYERGLTSKFFKKYLIALTTSEEDARAAEGKAINKHLQNDFELFNAESVDFSSLTKDQKIKHRAMELSFRSELKQLTKLLALWQKNLTHSLPYLPQDVLFGREMDLEALMEAAALGKEIRNERLNLRKESKNKLNKEWDDYERTIGK